MEEGNSKTTYFVRFSTNYNNERDAKIQASYYRPLYGNNIGVGYYTPQPKFKKWVPKFFIRWITK